MSKKVAESPTKIKGAIKKDREMLKQMHRRELEQAKLMQERQEAKAQIQKLKQTGLVSAYEQFLRSLCKDGLPEPVNIYELAAQYILKFEKKHKTKLQKKQELQRHNKQLIKNSIQQDSNTDLGQKSPTTGINSSRK